MSEKITSIDIKLALMNYYRFKRQFICVDECLNADIVADSGKEVIEVEVKISKSDLRADKKKSKHRFWKAETFSKYTPNKFYYCVPAKLEKDARKLIADINPKYGLILYYNLTWTVTAKQAKKLHKNYSPDFRWQIAKRCSSSLIGLYQEIHLGSKQLGINSL